VAGTRGTSDCVELASQLFEYFAEDPRLFDGDGTQRGALQVCVSLCIGNNNRPALADLLHLSRTEEVKQMYKLAVPHESSRMTHLCISQRPAMDTVCRWQ
jgi:hypothetical protein